MQLVPIATCVIDDIELKNNLTCQLNKGILVACSNRIEVIDPLRGTSLGGQVLTSKSDICCLCVDEIGEESKHVNIFTQGHMSQYRMIKQSIQLFGSPHETYRFLPVFLNLELQIKLEDTIIENKEEEIVVVKPIYAKSCKGFTILLLNNNTGHILSSNGQVLADIVGLAPPSHVLNQILNMDDDECECAVLVDQFTDLLDAIDGAKTEALKQKLGQKAINYTEVQHAICEACDNAFADNYSQFQTKTHVFGPQSLQSALSLYSGRCFKASTNTSKVRQDFSEVEIIGNDNDMLQFCVYGSYSDIPIFSVPLWMLNAANETNQHISLAPVLRPSGSFDLALIFENFMGSNKDSDYAYLKKATNFTRPYMVRGELNVRYDVQSVKYRMQDNNIIINTWFGGVQQFQVEIPRPFVDPPFQKEILNKFMPKGWQINKQQQPKNVKSIIDYDKQLPKSQIDYKMIQIQNVAPKEFYIYDNDFNERVIDSNEEFAVAGEGLGLLSNKFLVFQNAAYDVQFVQTKGICTFLPPDTEKKHRERYFAFYQSGTKIFGVKKTGIDTWDVDGLQ